MQLTGLMNLTDLKGLIKMEIMSEGSWHVETCVLPVFRFCFCTGCMCGQYRTAVLLSLLGFRLSVDPYGSSLCSRERSRGHRESSTESENLGTQGSRVVQNDRNW